MRAETEVGTVPEAELEDVAPFDAEAIGVAEHRFVTLAGADDARPGEIPDRVRPVSASRCT